jgi:hypothetical protein
MSSHREISKEMFGLPQESKRSKDAYNGNLDYTQASRRSLPCDLSRERVLILRTPNLVRLRQSMDEGHFALGSCEWKK